MADKHVKTEKIGKVFRKEKKGLLNFIRSKVASMEDSEDILQDVFSSLVDVTTPVTNLAGWLYKSASNRVIDFYRKKKLPRVPAGGNTEEQTLEDLIKDSGISTEKAFIRDLVFEELTKAIEELPGEQKEVIIGQGIQGLTFKELAKKTGESINTLMARKRYALIRLAERLKEMKELITELS